MVLDAAGALCDGRVVVALEGGYDPHALARCAGGTLKEQLLWVEPFETVQQLRLALLAFKDPASTATAVSTTIGFGSRQPSSISSASASAATCCALGEDRLDRAVVLLACDDLPGEHQHQVVAVVPVGRGRPQAQGVRCGRKRVARLMRSAGLHGIYRRRGRHARPAPAVHDDRVRRRFVADAPDRLWLTDITGHPTRERKVYCAAVLDVYSRRILGRSNGEHTPRDEVVQLRL